MWNLLSSSRNVCPFNRIDVKGNYIDAGAAEIACIGIHVYVYTRQKDFIEVTDR